MSVKYAQHAYDARGWSRTPSQGRGAAPQHDGHGARVVGTAYPAAQHAWQPRGAGFCPSRGGIWRPGTVQGRSRPGSSRSKTSGAGTGDGKLGDLLVEIWAGCEEPQTGTEDPKKKGLKRFWFVRSEWLAILGYLFRAQQPLFQRLGSPPGAPSRARPKAPPAVRPTGHRGTDTPGIMALLLGLGVRGPDLWPHRHAALAS